jgi:zinc/manganese transport system substrate-binding protein
MKKGILLKSFIRRVPAGLLVFLALGIPNPPCANAKLNVVATTPDIGSIAVEVGGAEIELAVLARPTEDPHFIDAKPSFIAKLRKADVLIEGGAELESAWLSPLVEGARNPKILRGARGHVLANKGVRMLEVPTELNRAKGDIHVAGNPHFLVDPLNARTLALNLAEAFADAAPEAAATFSANSARFVKQLDARLRDWQRTLTPFKGQDIVGYHNAWPYFAERFGLNINLFLEPKPGIPATPAHLASVITAMKARNVRVIIVDQYLDRRTAEVVAARTGATVVEVTHYPGGIKGTEENYLKLMDYLVNRIAAALDRQK